MRMLGRIVRIVGRSVFRVMYWGLCVWAVAALFFLEYLPNLVAGGIALAFAVGVLVLLKKIDDRGKATRWSLAGVLVVYLFWNLVEPKNARDWCDHQATLPQIEVEDRIVKVRNVRNFEHKSIAEYQIQYDDRQFDLNKIESVWYGVQNFASLRGLAHTFVSFGFRNRDGGTDYVAISVEVRREIGEKFSPWLGMFKRFELMYVIGDERDVVGTRSHIRRDEVRLYPVDATHNQMKMVFLDMVTRAQKLVEHPEFYNTWTNNCTNNIVAHVAKIAPKTVSAYDPRVIFPGYSDRIAFSRGMIKTNLTYDDARREFLIRCAQGHFRFDADGERVGLVEGFSAAIRQRNVAVR